MSYLVIAIKILTLKDITIVHENIGHQKFDILCRKKKNKQNRNLGI